MKEKDIKLLWGRAASLCSICRRELTHDAVSSGSAYLIGEHAHIVGDKEDAARGKSALTAAERDSYHNRILLCPDDHTTIDKNEADWPVEKLYLTKSSHELWVKENLSKSYDAQRTADELAATTLIDNIVTHAELDKWNLLVRVAYGIGGKLPVDTFDAYQLRLKIASAIIPESFAELSRAAHTFTILLLRFQDTFMEHVDLRGDFFHAEKFYKGGEGLLRWNPNYQADLELFNEWTQTYSDLLVQATKAANWFADVVRRDINPLFFLEHGRFFVNMGMGADMQIRTVIPEYSEDEKARLPDSLPDPPPANTL